jgi:hypothetical protein
MKVFISWSGDLSHKLAEAFRTWLPGALQTARPYFTPADIEKGARWSNEIAKELESSDVGVLFVTRDNVNSSWLFYEAGALSKKLEESRVCPIITGLTHNDLPGPLRQLQATELKEEDFRKLLKTINSVAGENKLGDAVLDQVFEMWWPKLSGQFKSILENQKLPEKSAPLRKDREILEEILELTRLNSKRRMQSLPMVHPRVVADLMSSLTGAVRAIQGQTDPQAALKALSGIRDPLKYLLRRIDNSSDTGINVSEMSSELEALLFEYQASDDEEIPF